MCLGIPGQILEIGDSASHLAKVNLSGTPRTVDISLVDEEGATVGEWVLVHAGFALSKISETEARDILELFREMSELNAEDETPAPAPPATVNVP